LNERHVDSSNVASNSDNIFLFKNN